MKILVDADACPVKDIILQAAGTLNVDVVMITNTNHNIESRRAQVIIVDHMPEAVDIAIVNRTCRGDVIVTQDYGLASMVLAKGARAIHPDGRIYNESNIETLLTQRYISARARRAGLRTKGPSRRTKEQDVLFRRNLMTMLEQLHE